MQVESQSDPFIWIASGQNKCIHSHFHSFFC